MDSLKRIIETQRNLQEGTYGFNYLTMSYDERITYIKDMKLALDAELGELLDEVPWKPWTTDQHPINRNAYVGELIDALKFWINLLLVVSGTETAESLTDEILTRFTLKTAVNEKRAADGYDGVSTKCGGCGRALDDTAVACRRVGDQGWCAFRNADINYISDDASQDTPVICVHCQCTINEHGCVPATIERWGHCGIDQRHLPPIKLPTS